MAIEFSLGSPKPLWVAQGLRVAGKVAARVFSFNFRTVPRSPGFWAWVKEQSLPFTLTAAEPGLFHVVLDFAFFVAGKQGEGIVEAQLEELERPGPEAFERLDEFFTLGINNVPKVVESLFDRLVNSHAALVGNEDAADQAQVVQLVMELPPIWFADP